MNADVRRRRFLLAMLASVSAPPRAARGDPQTDPSSSTHADGDSPFDVIDLAMTRDRGLARRCRIVVPGGAFETPLPILVLLHGLGETKNERAGSEAWLASYGLGRALERLRKPPLTRDKENYLSDAELTTLNGSLVERPFSGLILVCPYMPNPYGFPGGPATMLARYARFLEEVLLPAVRQRIKNAHPGREGAGIAGVSLGGYAALEVGLRVPGAFATIGTVQGAFSPWQASDYARRFVELAGSSVRGVYVATSLYDPYRAANERFGRKLVEGGVPARLSVRRGPHSQGFLREVASIDLLLWHDRALRGRLETGETQPS